MIFRQATQEDFDYVSQNPFEGAVKDYPPVEVPDENCYTTIYEGAIVAVGGLVVLRKGLGVCWLILTANCKKKGFYGIVALSAIKDKTEELIQMNNIKRAQATVRTDFPQAIKMIEFLGFQREGLLRKYCPDGGDSYIYARLL